jgi:DNA-binding XRE family transcriptional regulator
MFNDITDVQNSDEENEYMKSMLPKQKSYIPRFALLIHVLNYYMDMMNNDPYKVSKQSILKAEKLSKYFIQMAKKVKVNTIVQTEMKTISKANEGKSSQDVFYEMYRTNPDLNKKDVAELLGVSRQQIYNYIKQLEKKV